MPRPIADDDEVLSELPPLEDGSDGDAPVEDEIEYDHLEDDDPLDDEGAKLGEDGLEIDEVPDDDGDDGTEADREPDDGSDIDEVAAEGGLGADLEEPGVGDEAFEIDDDVGGESPEDRGEEGPSEADEELRAEDLPELDADDDGEIDDSTLFEPGAFIEVPRHESYAWADDAWSTERLVAGSYSLVALGDSRVVAAGLAGLVEVVHDEEPVRLSAASIEVDSRASLAVSKSDIVLGLSGRVSFFERESATFLSVGEHADASASAPGLGGGTLRLVGSPRGVFALGRKGTLYRLATRGREWVAVETLEASPRERPSARDLQGTDLGRWVHAVGVGSNAGEPEALAVVLDDATGELLLERTAGASVRLPALSDEHVPTRVSALGQVVALHTDDAGVIVVEAASSRTLSGTAKIGAFVVADRGSSDPAPMVVTAHAEEGRVSLVAHTLSVDLPARLVATFEPDERSNEAAHDEGDAVAHDSVSMAFDAKRGELFVATPFGLFVARPAPRTSKS
jgi:hypothetical protein